MEPNQEETLPILDHTGQDWPTEYTGAKVVQGEYGAYFLAPTAEINRYTDYDAAAADITRSAIVTADPFAPILESNARVESAVNKLIETVEGVATLIAAIQAQLGPTLETLQSNPMFKMMFGGKKNG